MLIRSEERIDYLSVREVINGAFGRPDESALVDRLRTDGDAVLSAIAVENQIVVGHAMLSKVTGPFRALGLAPVAVAPRYQRRGIATELIRWLLRRAEDGGWQGIFVLGHPQFYCRFGFEPALARDFTCRHAGSQLMALALGAPFPTTRGLVEYPQAFSALP